MDINKKIEDVNKKIEELDLEKDKLENQINDIKEKKEKITEKFIIDNTNEVEGLESLIDEVNTYMRGENSLSNIRNSFRELYFKSFHGIISGRIETNIKISDKVKESTWEKELWLNSRGLAFKPNDRYYYWSYRQHDKDATKMMDDFKAILYIVERNPDIEDYIKKEDKKEIFRAFRKCALAWRDIDLKDNEIKLNTNRIKIENNYSEGIQDLSIINYDKMRVSIESDLINLNFSKKDAYYGYRIVLGAGLSDDDRFMLGQLDDRAIGLLEDIIDNVKKVYENNSKAYSKFREEVSPYILHRLI